MSFGKKFFAAHEQLLYKYHTIISNSPMQLQVRCKNPLPNRVATLEGGCILHVLSYTYDANIYCIHVHRCCMGWLYTCIILAVVHGTWLLFPVGFFLTYSSISLSIPHCSHCAVQHQRWRGVFHTTRVWYISVHAETVGE